MPSKYTSVLEVCFPCKYFQQRLFKSGLDPIYDATCNHPTVIEIYGNRGRLIGRNDPPRPGWCPIRGDKQAEREAEE